MKFTPSSIARSSASSDSLSSAPIHIVRPMPQAPKPTSDTSSSVLPSRLRFMRPDGTHPRQNARVTEHDAAVDQLHAAPLEDFVAERKRLAKELRGAGERDAAAKLAKLPK